MKITSSTKNLPETQLDIWRSACAVIFTLASFPCAAIHDDKRLRSLALPPAARGLIVLSRLQMHWSTRPRNSMSFRSREIFGPEGEDIVFSGEIAQDRQRAT